MKEQLQRAMAHFQEGETRDYLQIFTDRYSAMNSAVNRLASPYIKALYQHYDSLGRAAECGIQFVEKEEFE